MHRRVRIEYKGVDLQNMPDREEGEDSGAYWDRYSEWLDTAVPVQPNVGSFMPIEYPSDMLDEDGQLNPEHLVDLKKEYAYTGLQVIVKLANIHLTPEKPEYGGGTWHIEGQMVRLTLCKKPYHFTVLVIERTHLRNGNILLRQREHHTKLPRVPADCRS